MRKILLLFLVSLVVFSCQKTENKKKWPVASETKVIEQNKDTIPENSQVKNVIVKLIKDRYAIITLEPYLAVDDDHDDEILYKPTKVKIFDSKTKQQVPETFLNGIYYSGNDDNTDIKYGDFNFDGKMDVVCRSRSLYYRDFYHYDFYLAKENTYELNKSFSVITDEPLSTIELDSKKKTILAVREAEWDATWLYEVKKNKVILIDYTSSSRSFDDEDDNSISSDSIQ